MSIFWRTNIGQGSLSFWKSLKSQSSHKNLEKYWNFVTLIKMLENGMCWNNLEMDLLFRGM